MEYLDKEIIFTFNNLNIVESKNYTYRLSVGNEVIFAGNIFLRTGQTSVDIDVTDIIMNYKPNPKDFATTNVKVNQSMQMDMINIFSIDLNISNTHYNDQKEVALIYRYPFRKRALETKLDISGTNFIQSGLYPKIPAISTLNYGLGVVYKNTDRSSIVISGEDVTVINDPNNIAYYMTANNIDDYWDGDDNDIYIRTLNKIAQDDVKPITGESIPGWVDVRTDENTAFFGHTPINLFRFETQTGLILTPFYTALRQEGTQRYSFMFNGRPEINGSVILKFYEADQRTTNGSLTFIQINEEEDMNDPNNIIHISFDLTLEDLQEAEWTFNNFNSTIDNSKSTKVAEVDACPAKYYLQWVDRYGALQSQPFDGKLFYSEDIETNEIQNYSRHRRKVNWEVQPKWEINTGWLDESIYPNYESIFVSPYVVLYDTAEDIAYDVIITDKTFKEEKFKNNKQMFSMTLHTELDKKQYILN